jgi:hypothetical protein
MNKSRHEEGSLPYHQNRLFGHLLTEKNQTGFSSGDTKAQAGKTPVDK